MPSLKTLGGVGAVLTCPCHAVPLVLLLGGTAGGAWFSRHLPVLMVALGAVFLASLWLMLRPERPAGVAAVCDTCATPASTDASSRAPMRAAGRVGQPNV